MRCLPQNLKSMSMKSKPTEWIVQPDTIRRKALRRYKEFLESWFQGKTSELFPMEIPCKKEVSSKANWGELTKQMKLLRELHYLIKKET